MKYLKHISIFAGILLAAFLAISFASRQKYSLQPPVQPTEEVEETKFDLKTNDEGAVSISVLPKIASVTNALEFEIVLNTHSVELNEDLTRASVLVDENGKEYRPVLWDGNPPGGHHREGVMRFSPILPQPKSITLKISEVGGAGERIFEWEIR